MLNALSNDAGGVLTPDFIIRLDNRDITANISNRLISLTLTDNRSFEVDQLDIQLDDADGQISLPQRGAVLSLSLGWKERTLVDKGNFVVDEVEHQGTPDVVTIRARSADFRGSLNSRREESWHDTSVGAIVEAIAARNKLTASIAPELAAIQIPHIDQSQESDAIFLTRLAERNGGEISVKAGTLQFQKAGRNLNVSARVCITRSGGDRHRFAIADRNAYTGVTAKWLHTSEPQPQKQKVRLQRQIKAPNLPALPQADGGQEGEYMAGEADNVFALTTVYATEAQAMRAAQAKWEQLQRGSVEFSINLAMGRADLVPDMSAAVFGFKRVIDEQPWTIIKVTHSLSNSGYTSALNLEVKVDEVEYDVRVE